MAKQTGVEPIRVVFDCNVLLQAMANSAGPAGQCFQLVRSGLLSLFVSRALIGELTDVASRPSLVLKLKFTADATTDFIAETAALAQMVDPVTDVYRHPIDPKDSMVVNLAVAASEHVITSRDRHLLSLRNPSEPAGREFMARFDFIDVLTPVELLNRLGTG